VPFRASARLFGTDPHPAPFTRIHRMSILNVDYSYRVFVTLLKRLNVDIQLQVVFVTLLKRLNVDIQLQVVLYFVVVDTGGTAGYDDIIVTKKLIRFEDLSYLVRLRE